MSSAALFCHNGLGDGINFLVLAHHFITHGWSLDTYHNSLASMQNWIPHVPIYAYPDAKHIPDLLERYDWFFVVQNKGSAWIAELIREGKRRFPERVKVFYVYPSSHIVNEPFYLDTCIQPTIPLAENLHLFCQRFLGCRDTVCSPGLIFPPHLQHRCQARRVVIHPTSGKLERNWSVEKFVKLALQLQQRGYEVVFIPGNEAQHHWHVPGIEARYFQNLDQLAAFLFESSYFIGNDSGPGHLASALGIPTLTLFNRYKAAALWRPSFAPGVVVAPSHWIPNLGGLRWRDRYWQRWISVPHVLRGFNDLRVALDVHQSIGKKSG